MASFDDDLQDAFDAADKALESGPYKKAMRELLNKSMDEIKQTVPKASYADYSKLLSVVEQASAANVAQADLKDKIILLGNKAVAIAKMIPSLAAIIA